MSGPFIFIATNRLKPDAYEAERRRVPGLVDFIEGGEPRLLAFNEYTNDERTEVTVVQVHQDAASMEFHRRVCGTVRGRPGAGLVSHDTQGRSRTRDRYAAPADRA